MFGQKKWPTTVESGRVGQFVPWLAMLAFIGAIMWLGPSHSSLTSASRRAVASATPSAVSSRGARTTSLSPTPTITPDTELYNFAREWTDPSWPTWTAFSAYPALALAVDSGGDSFVLNTATSLIQKYTPTGSLALSWGSPGTGNGQMEPPFAIAVDQNGHVFVGDGGNNRIQEFDGSGGFVTAWSGPDLKSAGRAFGIAVDSAGFVYLTSPGTNQVIKFDSTGKTVASWSSVGTTGGQLEAPAGVAVDGNGTVYVADVYTPRVVAFDSSGNYLRTVTSHAWNEEYPAYDSIAVDTAGSLYVADAYWISLEKFHADGSYDSRLFNYGTNPGQFGYALDVGGDLLGNAYVVDGETARLEVFASDPLYRREVIAYVPDSATATPTPTPFPTQCFPSQTHSQNIAANGPLGFDAGSIVSLLSLNVTVSVVGGNGSAIVSVEVPSGGCLGCGPFDYAYGPVTFTGTTTFSMTNPNDYTVVVSDSVPNDSTAKTATLITQVCPLE